MDESKRERESGVAHIENGGTIPRCAFACMLLMEIATVARAAADSRCRFKLIKEHCGAEYTAHWTCLDKQNQQYQYCRPEEAKLNTCVLAKLVPCCCVCALLRAGLALTSAR